MIRRPEAQPIHMEDYLRMERARRFRSEPDHATRGATFRAPEQKFAEIELSRLRERVGRQDKEARIEEAFSPVEVERERRTLWVQAGRDFLRIKVVYQPSA